MKQFQIKAKIIRNNKVADNYGKIIVSAPEIAKNAIPGQFVMAQVRDGYEPLLRRPLGIHRVSGNNIELLYEILGKGTRILSERKTAEALDLIGPLGNGFDYAASKPILVAGGMGVAPLIFLAEKIKEIKNKKSKIKNLVLIGAKTKNHILCVKEFEKLGFEVKIATDDGSKGFHGRVTELLCLVIARSLATGRRRSNLKSEIASQSSSARNDAMTIFACGPKPMLKTIGEISQKENILAQLSLEAHMSCGIGACLGCVVNTVNGYQRVCKDGPVFKARDIIW